MAFLCGNKIPSYFSNVTGFKEGLVLLPSMGSMKKTRPSVTFQNALEKTFHF